MKYFYLLFLILSLFSFTLEQINYNLRLRKCLSECRMLSNPVNRRRCEQNCYTYYGGH